MCTLPLLLCLTIGSASASRDAERAAQIVPGPSFRGTGFSGSATLLGGLMGGLGLETRPCASFSHEELNALSLAVLEAANPAYDAIYQARLDPRKLRTDAAGLREQFAREKAAFEADERLAEVARDGKCHELAMWLTHHLDADVREILGANFKVPSLSVTEHTPAANQTTAMHAEVFRTATQQQTCGACHADPDLTLPNPSVGLYPVWGPAHNSSLYNNGTNPDGTPMDKTYGFRWYDWAQKALREDTFGDDGEVTFSFIHVGPIMWMFQERLSFCIVAPIGFDPVAPEWMYGEVDGPSGGGFLLRTDRIGDYDVEVWDKRDYLSGDNHLLYAEMDFPEGSGYARPVRMEAEGPAPTGTSLSRKNFLEYHYLESVDPAVFVPPAYCDDAEKVGFDAVPWELLV